MTSGMRWLELEFQGKKVRVPAIKSQGKLWFHFRGQTHAYDLGLNGRRDGAGAGAAAKDTVTAPMPGKVTKVMASSGEKVVKGQSLVVMEAMKMEYTLTASRDGKIKEVSAQVGSQVALGQVLVRLEIA